MICLEVKAMAAHVLGWRQGEAMGVGLRPTGKPVDKPPNPKVITLVTTIKGTLR